jgi:hypothetical protein
MTFKIVKLNSGEKPSYFRIKITDDPRHVDAFVMTKKMTRYILPVEYRISVIFKDQDLGLFCTGIAKAGKKDLVTI